MSNASYCHRRSILQYVITANNRVIIGDNRMGKYTFSRAA